MTRATRLNPDDFDEGAVPPACRPTVDRVQRVLDGDRPTDDLAADPHPAACPTCRTRVRAARLLIAALAAPPEPGAVPVGFADVVLAGVRADRRFRLRRRVFAAVGGLGAAAAVVLAVWGLRPVVPQPAAGPENPSNDMAKAPAPQPRPASPTQPPVQIETELAKATAGLRGTTRTITEPATTGSRVFAALPDFVIPPMPPVAAELEPARESLAELPAAARHGLEPVTASAQKAFARLLKDVGAVSTTGKPKS